MHKISIHDLVKTKPLNKYMSNHLDNKIAKSLKAGQGKNQAYRLKIGDRVLDTTTQSKHIVQELYRENGHNKVMSTTRFHRERDLIKINA